MRSKLLLMLGALLLVGACQDWTEPTTAPAVESNLARFGFAPGKEKVRVIVRLRSQADQARIGQEARASGATMIREYTRFPFLALEVNENALRGLLRSPAVVAVTEDVMTHPTLDSSIPVIGADQVHAAGLDGSGFAVAIFDSGIDASHPFVAGRVVEEACFSSTGSDYFSLCPNLANTMTGPGSASINVTLCMDAGVNLCDHGMHVAGIAAGNGDGVMGAPAAGVAPGADIIAIQVFTRITDPDDCNGRPAPCLGSWESDKMAAFEYLIGLANSHSIAAVNLSMGDGGVNLVPCDFNPLKTFVDVLWVANIATVITAGNSGLGGAVGSPGCISTAVTVGATDDADNVAGFSNTGTLVDVFAPGVDITSSVAAGFGAKQGTSMAAPHVAGAFAVMRQANPALHIHQILSILKNTGVPITYPTAFGNVTTPRIDLLAALGGAASQPPVLTANLSTVAVNEGAHANNGGTFSDADGDAVTLSASVGSVFDLGDGTWLWTFGTTDGPAQRQVVTITGTDDQGAEASVSFDLFVTNVAPSVSAGPDATLVSGQTFQFTGSFTDPGTNDSPWNWAIHWGDGTTTTGSTNTQGQPITASRQVCTAGNQHLTFSVIDKDSGSGSDDLVLTVDYLTAAIDLSPGASAKPVNLGGRGLLPVAILGSATFDASQVDPALVVLGDGVGSDTQVAFRKTGEPYAGLEDVNGDGIPDLVLQFRLPDLVANGDLTAASTQLVLSGNLKDGCTSFRGADAVVVVP